MEVATQKKNKHKEKSKALAADLAKLQEQNEQLDTELKELKVKHGLFPVLHESHILSETVVKQHDSELNYQKRRATQSSDTLTKQLSETQRAKSQLEQEIVTLKQSVEDLKQQVHNVLQFLLAFSLQQQ